MPKARKTEPKPARTSVKTPRAVRNTSQSVLDRITPLDSFQPLGLKIGFYGHSGTGKTRALGSFAEAGKMLHMVCSSNRENEALSIRGTKGIDVVEIREPDDLPELIEHATDSGEYSTIALDHITQYTNLVLSRIINLERMPEQSSWGLAKQSDYAQLGLQAKTYMRSLFDFPGNVIIIGQERVYDGGEDGNDDDDLKPTVSIASTPSVASWIAPACDYFVRTFKRHKTESKLLKVGKGAAAKTVTKTTKTGEVEYCLAVGPDPVYMTKFRVPRGTDLPDSIVVPENASVYQLLQPYLT